MKKKKQESINGVRHDYKGFIFEKKLTFEVDRKFSEKQMVVNYMV